MQHRYRVVFLCATFLSLLVFGGAFSAFAAPLFGTSESSSTRLKSFEKWTNMLERHAEERLEKEKDCNPETQSTCYFTEWSTFLESVEGENRLSQLREVNQYMNEAKYIVDPINWGLPDYWASPFQFFVKDGDCEDYSIAKFMSLRRLGITNDQMRVVVLNDENLGVIHAVLAVYVDNKIYILDNQIEQVVEDTAIHHYTPVYSINETTWWRHR